MIQKRHMPVCITQETSQLSLNQHNITRIKAALCMAAAVNYSASLPIGHE